MASLFQLSLLLSSLWSSVTAAPAASSSLSAPPPNATNTTTPPAGGIMENPPTYNVSSDFDFQSINLALNQEWIELDLFHHGLAMFSTEDFDKAGIDAEDRYLIQFMAEQEVGHAKALTNILGPRAAKPCKYRYPFTTVKGFVDFCQKLTRFGESGVYGFLNKLDSRSSAQILLQSITTEARQQMIFRQFEGLFPMPVWFEAGITQSMAWTLLAPYLETCPAENPRIEWNNFPALNITNNPDATKGSFKAAITTNRTRLSFPGRELHLQWEKPGKKVGYNNSFTTKTDAVAPKFAVWISQLNATYTPLNDLKSTSATTLQPNGTLYPEGDPLINGTVFVAITDDNPFVTPFNISELDAHIVAGPALYQSG